MRFIILRVESVLLTPAKWFCLAATLWLLLPSAALAAASEVQLNQPPPGVTSMEAALSVNEPMYFVIGGGGDIKGRFQFSFKYRIFDQDSRFVRNAGWLGGIHFAYTQTSLWNLSADSAPFEDSSYRPSIFWDFPTRQKGLIPAFIRTGFEHESNGQGDASSRSINTLFFWPFWGGEWLGRDWIVAPKLYAYLDKGEFNQDIEEYRGYADLWLRYGHEDSWLLSTTLRWTDRNRNMLQLDLSYPIRNKILSRTGGFIYVQIFHGYGESLLTYDENQAANLRIGFAIVR